MNAQERKQALLDARLVCVAELEQLGIPTESMAQLSNIVARYTAQCVRVELAMRDAAAVTRKFTETMAQLGVTIETLNRKHTHGTR